MDFRLLHIWADLHELNATFNLANVTGRKFGASLFQEIMVSLNYRLLHLNYAITEDDEDAGNCSDQARGQAYFGKECQSSNAMNNEIHESLRLGMLAFSTTIFLQMANLSMRFDHLAGSLEAALRTLHIPTATDRNGWEMRLWLLFVVGISILGDRIGGWLRENVLQVLDVLKLNTWKKVRFILKDHLWIDMIHDSMGEEMFRRYAAGRFSSKQRKCHSNRN